MSVALEQQSARCGGIISDDEYLSMAICRPCVRECVPFTVRVKVLAGAGLAEAACLVKLPGTVHCTPALP